MLVIDELKLVYRDKFRSLHNEAFQTWIEELSHLLHPVGDFQAIRKARGDGGLDGFVINSQLVYQVYAPARIAELYDSITAKKIKVDFAKANSKLNNQMKAWAFIHNHPEAKIGQLSARAISDLETQHKEVTIRVLNIDTFWDELKNVPHKSIAKVLNVTIPDTDEEKRIHGIVARLAVITKRDAEEKSIFGISKHFDRSEVGYVEDLLEAGKPALVTGEAGVGKSGVAYVLCSPRADANLPVLYLDVRRYARIQYLKELSQILELRESLMDSIRLVGQDRGCRLIIDQLDNAATVDSGKEFIDLAKEASKVAKVQVVVLSRRQEGYEREMLIPLIEQGFEQIPCNELSESAATNTLNKLGVASPTTELVKLCQNLLNLDIVARMRQKNSAYDFSSISDEFDLWDEYVNALEKVERESPQGTVFGKQVTAEATKLARSGVLDEEQTFPILPTATPEQRRLESWGIIVPYEGYFYRFRHEKFRDFLYVRDAVMRGFMPADVLNEVHSYRVQSILVWMNAVYPRKCPFKYVEFFREYING